MISFRTRDRGLRQSIALWETGDVNSPLDVEQPARRVVWSRERAARWIQLSRRRCRRRRRRRRHPTAITPLCEFARFAYFRKRCTGKHKQLRSQRERRAASSSDELHAWKIYEEKERERKRTECIFSLSPSLLSPFFALSLFASARLEFKRMSF